MPERQVAQQRCLPRSRIAQHDRVINGSDQIIDRYRLGFSPLTCRLHKAEPIKQRLKLRVRDLPAAQSLIE